MLIIKLIIEHYPTFKRIYGRIQSLRDSQNFEMLMKYFTLAIFYFAPINALPKSIATNAEFDTESTQAPLIAEDRFEDVDSEKEEDIVGKKKYYLS